MYMDLIKMLEEERTMIEEGGLCKTGIEELDIKLGGGIPPGTIVLSFGGRGSAKALCVVNLIDLRIISERLGLDTEKYTVEDASALLDILRDIADELNVKRLVIDSITALCYRLQTPEMIRDFIFKLGSSLASMSCTTLLTSEIPPRKFQYSQYGIEEFISDGIIFLGDVERRGDLIRTLQIVKMRGTAHSRTKFALNISTEPGIELMPLLN